MIASIILKATYSAKFPKKAELNATTAITGGTYANSVWTSGSTGVIKKVIRLDAGTTADVITILDSGSNATDLVFARTGVAAGDPCKWDLGDGVAFPKGGFGVTVTSGGTAGTYVIVFDYANSVV